MKFGAIFLSSLATAASATQLSLRGFFAEQAPVEHVGGRVVVRGLHHDLSENDVAAIGETVVSSFNKVYAQSGFSLGGFGAKASTSVALGALGQCNHCQPDDDLLEASKAGIIMANFVANEPRGSLGQCNHCQPDDDLLGSFSGAFVDNNKMAKMHSLFEADFCASLRESRMPNLRSASGCEVSFSDNNGYSTSGDEAHVVVQGTVRNMTPEDIKIFEKTMDQVYNDAFPQDMNTAFTVELETPVEKVGGPCNYCPPDDDISFEESTLIVVSKKLTQCNYCPPDDWVQAELSEAQMDKLHSAFEKALCNTLKASGSVNFAGVHGCKIEYIRSPTDAAQI